MTYICIEFRFQNNCNMHIVEFDLTKAFLNIIYCSLIRMFNLFNLCNVLNPKISKLEINFKQPKDHSEGSLSMTKLFLGPFVVQQDGGEAKEASRRQTWSMIATFASAHSWAFPTIWFPQCPHSGGVLASSVRFRKVAAFLYSYDTL